MAEFVLRPPTPLLQREPDSRGEYPPVRVQPRLFTKAREVRTDKTSALFVIDRRTEARHFFALRRLLKKDVTANLIGVPYGATAELSKITLIRRREVEPGETFGSGTTDTLHVDDTEQTDVEVIIGNEQPTGFVFGRGEVPDEHATSLEEAINCLKNIPMDEIVTTHGFSYTQALPYQPMQIDGQVAHLAPYNQRLYPVDRDLIVAGYQFI